MKFCFLGGAMEVGGSCIYIRTAEHGILLDSGIRQGSTKDPLPDFRTIQANGGVDVILVSHAHMDHIGTLPIISKEYPQAKIYMTHMTQDLVRVLLYDSLKIMGSREDEIPHYSEADVKHMLNRIYPVRYQAPTEILPDVTMTLYLAGHIAGAACIYLVTAEGSIFYSGDFSAFAQRTIEGAKIPKLRPDVAIVESTYGNRLHANRQVEENRLAALLKECVDKEMKVLVPAFALGRSQEVLLILRSAMQNGEIPKVPVYVDGMVRDINTMYYRNPTYLRNTLAKRIFKGNEPFYTDEIQAVGGKMDREELLAKKGPIIFVASSGMLTGGPSMLYAKKLAAMENACIIITGYQDEEAPGRALLDLLEQADERKITLDGTVIPVKCRIEQVGLSAHADKSEIAALMDRIAPRKIFLVHGDKEAIGELANEVSVDYRRQVYMPKCGEDYEILVHNKRKQLTFTLPHTMQRKTELMLENQKELWLYVREHYEARTFTIEQLAFIWYGTGKQDESVLQKMQAELMQSPYFSTDPRRLFLFAANTEEQVQENTAPKRYTNQQLEEFVKETAQGLAYKKLGFFEEEKKVVMTFDYPDAQDRALVEKCAEVFLEKTGWELVVSESVNHQAMGMQLRKLFGTRILKVSYYQEKKQYAVTLQSHSDSDLSLAKQFQEITGWGILIKGSEIDAGAKSGLPSSAADKLYVEPKEKVEVVEQNLAFFCVEQAFEEEAYAPYKKSIKSDTAGKYIELSFLSPELGRRVSHVVQSLANQIGWRMSVAESVNQNEVANILLSLCDEYGIRLAKNPSYHPQKKVFKIKLADGEAALPEGLQETFCERTGCGLEM